MNIQEAALMLGLSKRKLYELAQSRKIACYRFGSSIRFDIEDLEAYKTSCRSPATTQANGFISLTATLPGQDSALTAFFQRAGRKSKPTSSTALKAPASTRLQLV